MHKPSTGGLQSHYDARTIKHDLAGQPLIKGGYDYAPNEIENQQKVGICTAISLVQNAQKVYSKKYSPDFQYLLQKKYYDKNWDEGSSIFNSLKVGKNYGFLPIGYMNTYVTELDRSSPYSEYIKKLRAIPESEITRLVSLCENKLTGYGEVDVSNSQNIAKAIDDSKSGVLCRYVAGDTWYTDINGNISWLSRDIDPLRKPVKDLSGHAIGMISYDYTSGLMQTIANTWSPDWNTHGKGHMNYGNYQMTEAWIPYYDFTPTVPVFKHNFQIDMEYGDKSDEVLALQKALSILGYFKVFPTGLYGDVTRQSVLNFQVAKVPISLWERYVIRGSIVGPKTRLVLNQLFNKS